MQKKLRNWKLNSSFWRTVFDIGAKRKKFEALQKEIQKADLWQNKEKAVEITQRYSNLQQELSEFDEIRGALSVISSESEIREFAKKLDSKEIEVFLPGRYDKGSAVLSIFAGAGGQDAQDWATMLLRMYLRYADRRGFSAKVLHQSFGDPGPEGRIGTKSVTVEIKGNLAYGLLKKENGVHRLVRISPFSAQSLRHTSFAMVEVMPEISKADEEEIKINPEDLRVETFRASGPGGQYVNRRESAVRITHLPTKITVSCQSERLQGQNRDTAMKLLYAKLFHLKEQEREKELEKIKGKAVSIEWGNQIRSYVLHPYRMVKDARTNVETADTESVLDGDIDKFIEAEIRL